MSLHSAETYIPTKGGRLFVSVGGKRLKEEIIPAVRVFQEAGYELYATEHTCEALSESGIKAKVLYKISEPYRKPNIMEYITARKLDIIINIASASTLDKYASMMEDEYIMRRKAVEFNIPVFTNLQLVKLLAQAVSAEAKRNNGGENARTNLKPLEEYMEGIPWKLW
jgi:carbamoyl-phosphate synthase large subunit